MFTDCRKYYFSLIALISKHINIYLISTISYNCYASTIQAHLTPPLLKHSLEPLKFKENLELNPPPHSHQNQKMKSMADI